MTTDDLAGRIGVEQDIGWRQVADLSPETRNALRGTARRSLNDLLNSLGRTRSREGSDNWCRRTPENPGFHIDTANIEVTTDRDKSALVGQLKEKWGVPFSVMRFDRENHQLSRICRQVTKHTECRVIKGDVTGREMPNYSGFVDHSLFLLEYFVRTPVVQGPGQLLREGHKPDRRSLVRDGDARV